jgi:pyridoxine 5-phosphate synthase
MIRLGINIDHVATLRQARRGTYPDPVHAAVMAEMAGADEITVHLREDRRHIQDRDGSVLREIVSTRLNLEMAATEEILRFSVKTRPDSVTLVPERREELTTEGGLDLTGGFDRITQATGLLKAAGIPVYLFVDPETAALEAARSTGADGIELHTGAYADAAGTAVREAELTRLVEAARTAFHAGLTVHAGHGLNLANVGPIASIPQVSCLQIGHSIVSRAVFVGLAGAVGEMRSAIESARRR